MANTIAVLEGGFGSVGQYWMTTMKASQVINSIYMPKDIPEWKKRVILLKINIKEIVILTA